ncbi:MAG: hypothetical protein JNM24_10015 [Bdellovibrionaceae bacterium]|nr:hypothetical protein [Pseudobdellovibrionaceae bacterium]
MALIVLSVNQSYNPGAELWIVPDFDHSKIASKLDWYNSFLAGKMTRKESKKMDSYLVEILEETELPDFKYSSSPDDIILIPTKSKFPNRWTAFVPYKGGLANWCSQINKLYLDLKNPSLRIFLPTNLSLSEFTETWRSISSVEDLSIVLEN